MTLRSLWGEQTARLANEPNTRGTIDEGVLRLAAEISRRDVFARGLGLALATTGIGRLPGVRLFDPLPRLEGGDVPDGTCRTCAGPCTCGSCNPACFSPNFEYWVPGGKYCCPECSQYMRVKVCNDGSASHSCVEC